MAEGACREFGVEVGIAVTGIAGPTGGTPEKPEGTVWLAVRVNGAMQTSSRRFVGDREEVRQRAAQASLDMVRRALSPQI